MIEILNKDDFRTDPALFHFIIQKQYDDEARSRELKRELKELVIGLKIETIVKIKN